MTEGQWLHAKDDKRQFAAHERSRLAAKRKHWSRRAAKRVMKMALREQHASG